MQLGRSGNGLVVTNAESMVAAFEASAGEPLPERLLKALEAGDATGGDRGGNRPRCWSTKPRNIPMSACVDENMQPVQELRRIFETCRTQLLPLMDAMPSPIWLGDINPDDPNIANLITR
ncbi:MAG: DUF1028 domain-containing protein [Caldilineaceae bacterium]